MVKTAFPTIFSLVLLAGCAPPVPNSAPSGVGFGDYEAYQAQQARREAALTGAPIPQGLPVSPERATPPPPLSTGPVGPAPQTLDDLGPVDLNNPGISDEQSFDAVSTRETIESDAERIARQRAARAQVAQVTPGALPERPRDIGPNIVQYALATTNPVGQPVYSRRRVSDARHERNCRQYGSPDQAQTAFLESGGPQRDRQGLDPDGDGFACAWNPAPFRAARGG